MIGLREEEVSQEELSMASVLKRNVKILPLISVPREKQLQRWQTDKPCVYLRIYVIVSLVLLFLTLKDGQLFTFSFLSR